MNQAKPVIIKKHWLSGIWLLPLVAALVGGWTIYQSIIEKGIEVSILFQDADGVREGKTPIIYKGVRIGVVKKVSISDNLEQVKIIAEIRRSAAHSLRETTGFWLVKPKVSITEITGLDTIVSGNYISMVPGQGEHRSEFVALDKPPITRVKKEGLYLDIFADNLGSLTRGSTVYFRQIPVGQVLDYELASSKNGVIIKTHIEGKYAHLVKKSSRFWNASGLLIKGGLSGFSVKTESLASLLSGGIAFYTPNTDSSDNAINDSKFKLHSDFDSAKVGILAKISFQSAIGLQEGITEVRYDAFKIGIVKKLKYKQTGKSIIAEVMFDPRASDLLTTGTKFWLDKPKLSLTDFTGLTALLQGNHIRMQVGQGASSRSFVALNKPPFMTSDDKGIHLVLKAKTLGSIEYASPILYKNIRVGRVYDFKLDKKGKHVLIDIYITERYKHLVAPSSRFWNASGIQVKLGTAGIDVSTGTIGSMLNGGIEFITPILSKKKVGKGAVYNLYSNQVKAKESSPLAYKPSKNEQLIYIRANELGSLDVGSKIYFKKIPVGKVVFYRLSNNNESILITVALQHKYQHLLHDSSRFWRNSGLKIKAGLSGVEVDMASVNALLSGGISFSTPEQSNKKQVTTNKVFSLYPDEQLAMQLAQPIKIQFSLARGVIAGTPIKYLGIPVGEVTSVVLSDDNQSIIAEAKLIGSAIDFARSGTKFWLVSAQLGLFKSKHLGTLVKGNYLEIEPGTGKKQLEFIGKLDRPEITKGLHIVLQSARLGSIKVGNPVAYRQITVGEVRAVHLSANARQVLIDIYIAPKYAPLVKNNTKFWRTSGFKMDFGLFDGVKIRAESVENIVVGGIAFATPEPDEKIINVLPGQVFDLYAGLEEEWLAWRPEIALEKEDKP